VGKKISVENLVKKEVGMALILDVTVPVLDVLPDTPITPRVHGVLGIERRNRSPEGGRTCSHYRLQSPHLGHTRVTA
jgi:hypothetical protein